MSARRPVLLGLGLAILLSAHIAASGLAQEAARSLVLQVKEFRLVLDRTNVTAAEAATDHNGQPMLKLEVAESARDTLAEMTNRSIGREMTVMFGERVLSKPVIREPILDGAFVIGGVSEADLQVVLDALR